MRYAYEDVMPIAYTLKALLAPGCQKIEIAGSLRRQRPTVKDIELVAQPTMLPIDTLFGDIYGYASALDPILAHLQKTGYLSLAGKNGERYKQFRVRGEIGPKLDLFIVLPPAQWGVIFAIRTGPAAFSRRLVTSRRHGGMLPSHLHVKGGAVRHNAAPRKIIETPTEAALFELLEMDWIPPEKRQ